MNPQNNKISACPACGVLRLHPCIAEIQCTEKTCPVLFSIEDGKCKGKGSIKKKEKVRE